MLLARLALSTAHVLRRIALWPLHVAKARREMRLLCSLSETQLRDIGLAQYDLIAATGLPMGEDPTLFLKQRIAERRANVKTGYIPGALH